MTRAFIIAALLLATTSGCGYFRDPCSSPGTPYTEIREQPPLVAPTGLSVPEQDPNLSIPESTGPRVPYRQESVAQEGKKKKKVQCLSHPPPFREQG